MIDKLSKKAGRAWKNANTLQKVGMVAGGAAAVPFLAAAAPAGAAAALLNPTTAAAAGGAKFHADRKKRVGWQLKQMAKADMARMAEGPQALQLSDSEQQQMLQQSQEQANLQAQSQQANIAQNALAGGEFNQGAFAQAQQQAAAAAQASADAAVADVQQANRAQIDAETARIRGDMAAREKRNREATKYWAQFGVGTALNIAGKSFDAMESRESAATGPQTQTSTGATDQTGTPVSHNFGTDYDAQMAELNQSRNFTS